MMTRLLVRGMFAGLCAGILAFGFARVVGEPAVGSAIAFERLEAAAVGEQPMPALVSRDVQGGLGLLTGVGVYGIALGGLFALVFAAVYGRLWRASPARTAVGLAAAAFTVVYLVPFLKYPANPPAVGQPDTIGQRAGLYLAMVAISLLGAAYAVWLGRRLEARSGPTRARLASAAAYLVIVLVGGLALPGVNEVPAGFPAGALWNFRVASLGTQAIVWTTIGLLFAFLAERSLNRMPAG